MLLVEVDFDLLEFVFFMGFDHRYQVVDIANVFKFLRTAVLVLESDGIVTGLVFLLFLDSNIL